MIAPMNGPHMPGGVNGLMMSRSFVQYKSPYKLISALRAKMFAEIYKSREDQKIIAPTVLKIVEDFPNKKFREKIQEMLKNGRLEN